MTDRILLSPDGVKISRPGVDVKTASADNLLMYPGMSSMTMVIEDVVTLAGGQQQVYTFANPFGRIPYVILSASNGDPADREIFCAETSAPYNYVVIRNDVQDGAPTRTITFAVLIDNLFI